MQETRNPRYTLSGNLGMGAVVIPVGGVIAIVVLSIIYAYINVYSPVAGWVSILFVAGFAFGVGLAFALLAEYSKCRNVSYTRVFGGFAGIFAFYTSWAMFIQVLFSRDIEEFEASKLDVFMEPALVWESAKLIAEHGWYSIGSMTPSGIVLWAFWGIEALIIVGISWLICASSLEDEVFCEDCGQWATEMEGIARVEMPANESEIEKILPENIALPLALPPVERGRKSSIRYDSWHCNGCNDLHVLKANAIEYTRDKDGDIDEDEEDLGAMAIVSGELIAALEDWGQSVNEDEPEPEEREDSDD